VVSNLKWRLGFGWGAVGLFVLLVAVSFEPTGIVRWIALPAALVVLAFIVFQYRAWNTKGWRQVHNRAMLLYASIAGAEAGTAQRDGREFDRVHACSLLAQVLLSERPLASNELVLRLNNPGEHLASIFEAHGREIVPNADAALVSKCVEYLRDLQLGPQLIVANLVDDRFGAQEAARYGLALLQGVAR
jgi:hypothetical protein